MSSTFLKKIYVANHNQTIIGNDVWISRGAHIMSGVFIGNGAVIGAHTVVAKNVPPYAIVVGNPARIIKYRFDPETIRKLQAIRWWNWSLEKIHEHLPYMNYPEEFADQFYSADLEKVPQTKLGNDLRNLKSRGFNIFSTILDFDAPDALWQRTIQGFSSSSLKNVALVLHSSNRFSYGEIQSKLEGLCTSTPDKWIFAIRSQNENPFELDALLETDILITTREYDSLLAIDALNGKIFEIRYAFDTLVFY